MHRARSGHVPWDHSDNARQQALDARQRQDLHAQREFARVRSGFQNRSKDCQPVATPGDHLPQVTLALAEPEDDAPLQVKIDPELGRVVVGLQRTSEFRVWAVARHFFGVPGWADREALLTVLRSHGVISSKRHFNRVLQQGRGLFWGVSAERVYLRGYVKLAARLTGIARKRKPDLVATNVPGVRPVYLRVGGELGDFKAQIYAGWLMYREAPTIARDTLCKLFACTKDTLRNWEARLGATLDVIPNYAQTAIDPRDDDAVFDYIPEHSYNYVTRRGELRIRWRQPNTYNPHHIWSHAHKGQSRKARTASVYAAWVQPVETWAAPASPDKLAFDRSHREPKRYFADAKRLRRLLRRLGEGETPYYVFRGRDRYDHGIWELSLDGEVYTTAWERMTPRAENGYMRMLAARWAEVRARAGGNRRAVS